MIQTIKRAVCDHCKRRMIVNEADDMAAERVLERVGWKCPRIGHYGGTGHYCQNHECQLKAKEVEYKS